MNVNTYSDIWNRVVTLRVLNFQGEDGKYHYFRCVSLPGELRRSLNTSDLDLVANCNCWKNQVSEFPTGYMLQVLWVSLNIIPEGIDAEKTTAVQRGNIGANVNKAERDLERCAFADNLDVDYGAWQEYVALTVDFHSRVEDRLWVDDVSAPGYFFVVDPDTLDDYPEGMDVYFHVMADAKSRPFSTRAFESLVVAVNKLEMVKLLKKYCCEIGATSASDTYATLAAVNQLFKSGLPAAEALGVARAVQLT